MYIFYVYIFFITWCFKIITSKIVNKNKPLKHNKHFKMWSLSKQLLLNSFVLITWCFLDSHNQFHIISAVRIVVGVTCGGVNHCWLVSVTWRWDLSYYVVAGIVQSEVVLSIISRAAQKLVANNQTEHQSNHFYKIQNQNSYPVNFQRYIFTFKICFYHFYNFRGNKKKSNKCKGLEDIDDVVSYKLPKCIELLQLSTKNQHLLRG